MLCSRPSGWGTFPAHVSLCVVRPPLPSILCADQWTGGFSFFRRSSLGLAVLLWSRAQIVVPLAHCASAVEGT